MAINLESSGLPIAATYGAPAAVQDQQGDGHGQQAPAQDAGYNPASAFEQNPGASIDPAAVQDLEPAGGDLLSKLGGFIRAVGDVMVQLGEYIRDAGGALGDTLTGQATPAAPQAPGAPVPQQVLAGPQASPTATLAAPPRQTNPSLNARPSVPAAADASRASSAASVGAPAIDLSAASAAPRGGARASQSSGYPVLNPLPPYLGDQLGFFNFGDQPEAVASQPETQGFEATIGTTGFEGFQGFEATVGTQEPQRFGLDPAAELQSLENAQVDQVGLDNVVPFPSPVTRDAFAGEASNDVTGAAEQATADALSPRYSGIVFRPAFYGNLRC